MAEKNIFDTLTQYRLKVEKDGKSVVDVPGILALPGLLAFPKLSIAGMIAAPVLGMKVRLEGGDGKPVDVEGAVRKAAETVKETAAAAAKTVKEEVDKAWEAVSADDPEETEETEETAETEETDGDDIPSIHVEDPDQH